MEKKLRTAINDLYNKVEDLSSLHIQTLTGEIGFIGSEGNYKTIEQEIATALKDAKVKLVAESLYKFDGDSYNFIAEGAEGIPSSALELHKAAIEGGIKTRQALLEVVKDLFG
jgi:hypothetical protein